jgi:hypothetical protein
VSSHGNLLISDQDRLRFPTRCNTQPHDFDNPRLRRCQEHTEALVEALELGELWDNYGLVGDIVVRISFYVFNLFVFYFIYYFLVLLLWYHPQTVCEMRQAHIGLNV